MKRSVVYLSYVLMVFAVLNNMSCKKDDPAPADVCAGKTIIITATPTNGDPGSINISATGSTGFTYKLNNSGTYQSSGAFSNVTPGTYTAFAKDADGCEVSKPVTVLSPTDPCAAKSIVVTATPTGVQPCGGSSGSISVSATGTGSTGFMYKLNSSGTYQPSGTFSNVAAGTYTIFARDADGCENNTTVTVSNAVAGALFTNAKNLIASRCQSCHNNSIANGGMNFQEQCNIIQFKSNINQRAVITGDMPQGGPQLSASEKKIITDWINAGGGYGN